MGFSATMLEFHGQLRKWFKPHLMDCYKSAALCSGSLVLKWDVTHATTKLLETFPAAHY